uniref:LIP-domain-containing protein n=1 Tax=Bionectria ochroleuca TaxID=29856 RepID=A0A8H7K724_BIOOC
MIVSTLLLFLLPVARAVGGPKFSIFDTPSEPLLPSNDPFYMSEPADLSAYSLGDLIRIRVAPGNLSAMFNASAVYNIVYRTEDSLGHPLWSFSTVFSPLNPYSSTPTSNHSQYGASSRAEGTAFLSYQLPYNTPNVDCSVSVLMYDPTQTATLGDVTAALQRGWFVSVPDFEGPFAASTAGGLEGKVILDGVRAVYSLAALDGSQLEGLEPLGLDAAHASFSLWGYSGGAISSGWAGEMQPYYAPDLQPYFAGLVIGGMPPGFVATADLLDGTSSAGLLPNALLGLTQQFPAAREFLVSSLKQEKAQDFLAALNMSALQAFVAFYNQSIFDYFINGRDDFTHPILTSLYDGHYDLRLKGVPSVPVFAYKAIGDQFSSIQLSDQLITEYCDGGAVVLYERNTVGEHISELQNGHSRSLDWLDSLFNGTHAEIYGTSACVVKNVTVVDPTGPPLGQL